MPILSKEQSADFEKFISKLSISKVRSDIERMYDAVKSDGCNFRVEELDKLKSYATHLPLELQSYPQTFSHWVKNGEQTERDEEVSNTPKKAKANLKEGVEEAHEEAKVKDKNIADETVSPATDNLNKAATEPLPERKEEIANLEEEAKKGDLERPLSAISLDAGAGKATEKKDAPKVVVVDKNKLKANAKKK